MRPAALVRSLLDLVAPRRCAGCDAALDWDEEVLCGACAPLFERAPGLGVAQAVFVFGGPVADAIRRLKYANRSDVAGPLGKLFADAAMELRASVDVVAPVPLHRRRLVERGYNQAALLAAPVARSLEVPLLSSALRRTRATRPQVGLGAVDRVENVRGAFEVRGRGVAGKRVLLIDDVRTTGATFAEASAALLAGGAGAVRTLALAVAVDGDA